jgi:hypothetical protein
MAVDRVYSVVMSSPTLTQGKVVQVGFFDLQNPQLSRTHRNIQFFQTYSHTLLVLVILLFSYADFTLRSNFLFQYVVAKSVITGVIVRHCAPKAKNKDSLINGNRAVLIRATVSHSQPLASRPLLRTAFQVRSLRQENRESKQSTPT